MWGGAQVPAKYAQSFEPRKRPETDPCESEWSRMISIASYPSKLPVRPRIVFEPSS